MSSAARKRQEEDEDSPRPLTAEDLDKEPHGRDEPIDLSKDEQGGDPEPYLNLNGIDPEAWLKAGATPESIVRGAKAIARPGPDPHAVQLTPEPEPSALSKAISYVKGRMSGGSDSALAMPSAAYSVISAAGKPDILRPKQPKTQVTVHPTVVGQMPTPEVRIGDFMNGLNEPATTGSAKEGAEQPGQDSPPTGEQTGQTNLPPSVAKFMEERSRPNENPSGAGPLLNMSPVAQTALLRMFSGPTQVGSYNPYLQKLFPAIAQAAQQRQKLSEANAELPMQAEQMRLQQAMRQSEMQHRQRQEDLMAQRLSEQSERDKAREGEAGRKSAVAEAAEAERERHNKEGEKERSRQLDIIASRLSDKNGKAGAQDQNTMADLDELEGIYKKNGGKYPGMGPGRSIIPEQYYDFVPGVEKLIGGSTDDARAAQTLKDRIRVGLEHELAGARGVAGAGSYQKAISSALGLMNSSSPEKMHMSLQEVRRQHDLMHGRSAQAPKTLTEGQVGGGQPAQKIRVSNGKETLRIDPADEAEAAKDGYRRVQ